jgi:hypothetical protein
LTGYVIAGNFAPVLLQCVGVGPTSVLDTRTGELVPGSLYVARVRSVIAAVADVRSALGFPRCRCRRRTNRAEVCGCDPPSLTYMERALACARVEYTVLEVLYPRLESERACPTCTVSAQGLTLRRLGKEIHPAAASLLIALRASARAVEAAGLQEHGGDMARQLAAAQASIARGASR